MGIVKTVAIFYWEPYRMKNTTTPFIPFSPFVQLIQFNHFFEERRFFIPDYQRDYAWDEIQLDDLFYDIRRSLATRNSHYIGNFILVQQEEIEYETTEGKSRFVKYKFNSDLNYDVIDGQQRLTTLFILLNALIDGINDAAVQQFYRYIFLLHPKGGEKLQLARVNQPFFQNLIYQRLPLSPATQGQERLYKAYTLIHQRVDALKNSENSQEIIIQWLDCIGKMTVIEFIEPDDGTAIQLLQYTSNRGTPLSTLDTIRSLLIHYSNSHLFAALDYRLIAQFSDMYQIFDRIKRTGNNTWTEDGILQHHYQLFMNGSGADMQNSTAVVNNFLKPNLEYLVNCTSDSKGLRKFIENYVDSLLQCFRDLERLG